MDIEHLTKSQIILLTLLVSFMTSIATGIVTVSLLQQAPSPVTQTINRVVERTVERVVETKKDKTGNTVTNEKTVVVKETDLIADAVKATMPSVVAIYKLPPKTEAPAEAATTDAPTAEAQAQTAAVEVAVIETVTANPVFVGRGVFTTDNTVVTDGSLLEEGASYKIVVLTSQAEAVVTTFTVEHGLGYLTVPAKTGQGIKKDDLKKLQLGETMIELAGDSRLRVSTGIISDIEKDASGNLTGLAISGVESSLGSPIISLDGTLVAITVKGGWVPVTSI
jgi:hypothetical protein